MKGGREKWIDDAVQYTIFYAFSTMKNGTTIALFFALILALLGIVL